MYNCDIS